MASHRVRLSAEKLRGRGERRETNVEYYPWHTTEYHTAFLAPDWLYSSQHGAKCGSLVVEFDNMTLQPARFVGKLRGLHVWSSF